MLRVWMEGSSRYGSPLALWGDGVENGFSSKGVGTGRI